MSRYYYSWGSSKSTARYKLPLAKRETLISNKCERHVWRAPISWVEHFTSIRFFIPEMLHHNPASKPTTHTGNPCEIEMNFSLCRAHVSIFTCSLSKAGEQNIFIRAAATMHDDYRSLFNFNILGVLFSFMRFCALQLVWCRKNKSKRNEQTKKKWKLLPFATERRRLTLDIEERNLLGANALSWYTNKSWRINSHRFFGEHLASYILSYGNTWVV